MAWKDDKVYCKRQTDPRDGRIAEGPHFIIITVLKIK